MAWDDSTTWVLPWKYLEFKSWVCWAGWAASLGLAGLAVPGLAGLAGLPGWAWLGCLGGWLGLAGLCLLAGPGRACLGLAGLGWVETYDKINSITCVHDKNNNNFSYVY